METTETISATEFKAKCLDILDRVNSRQVDRVTITKRGRPVAVLVPAERKAEGIESLFGFMRGTVIIPEGLDLTAPICDVAFEAAEGKLPE